MMFKYIRYSVNFTVPPWSLLTSSGLDQLLSRHHCIAIVMGSPVFAYVGTSVVFFGLFSCLGRRHTSVPSGEKSLEGKFFETDV